MIKVLMVVVMIIIIMKIFIVLKLQMHEVQLAEKWLKKKHLNPVGMRGGIKLLIASSLIDLMPLDRSKQYSMNWYTICKLKNMSGIILNRQGWIFDTRQRGFIFKITFLFILTVTELCCYQVLPSGDFWKIEMNK